MRAGLRLWKALPAPLRESAHRATQGLSKALIPLWVALAWRRGRPVAPEASVAVLGLFRSSLGLGQGARLAAAALDATGVAVLRIGASPWVNAPADMEASLPDAAPRAGVLVSHLNPIELERAIELSRAGFLRGRRHIGYWVWELPVPPPSWRRAFHYVDEVWTPSRFSAKALRTIAPPRVSVHVVPHPMWAAPVQEADRAGFGLPDDRVVILVALDLKSTAARKNPDGAIDAYLRMAERTSGAAMLVCKISGRAAEPETFAALASRCAARRDIVLIDRTLTTGRMSALVASADIVFSPHRAEGFGLLPAEAMRLGKAVVATGWSGNMDYMDAACAALLDYRLVPAVDPQGLYAGAVWAEPDLEQAADVLEALVRDPVRRRDLGARARERGGPAFDPDAWRALVDARLRA